MKIVRLTEFILLFCLIFLQSIFAADADKADVSIFFHGALRGKMKNGDEYNITHIAEAANAY